MNNPEIWLIDQSHLVNVPPHVEVDSSSFSDIPRKVQSLADNAKSRLSFGKLVFKWELDNQHRPIRVFSYFTDRHGKQRRFMRLVRKV